MCQNQQFLIHQETTALAAGSQLLSHHPKDRENCRNQSMLEHAPFFFDSESTTQSHELGVVGGASVLGHAKCMHQPFWFYWWACATTMLLPCFTTALASASMRETWKERVTPPQIKKYKFP